VKVEWELCPVTKYHENCDLVAGDEELVTSELRRFWLLAVIALVPSRREFFI
jgi:hypothetical protein